MTQEREGQIGTGRPEGVLDKALPELKVSQVLKSPEPVLKINPNQPVTPEMGMIHPVREYTVVLAKGANEIQVFDKSGRSYRIPKENLENFLQAYSTRPKVRKALFRRFMEIARVNPNMSSDTVLEELGQEDKKR